jgi:hypothetical protein
MAIQTYLGLTAQRIASIPGTITRQLEVINGSPVIPL